MRTRVILLATTLAALTLSAAGRADETKKNEKFCAALGDFHSDVATLQSMGPQSTVADIRAASERMETDAGKVEKTGGKLKAPTAKQFTDSVRQLRVDAQSMPTTLTAEQAHSRIAADVQNVERATRQLATEAGCPEAAPQPGAQPAR